MTIISIVGLKWIDIVYIYIWAKWALCLHLSLLFRLFDHNHLDICDATSLLMWKKSTVQFCLSSRRINSAPNSVRRMTVLLARKVFGCERENGGRLQCQDTMHNFFLKKCNLIGFIFNSESKVKANERGCMKSQLLAIKKWNMTRWMMKSVKRTRLMKRTLMWRSFSRVS